MWVWLDGIYIGLGIVMHNFDKLVIIVRNTNLSKVIDSRDIIRSRLLGLDIIRRVILLSRRYEKGKRD
jgi:hypothetical protein